MREFGTENPSEAYIEEGASALVQNKPGHLRGRRIQGPSATAYPQVRPEDDRKTAMEKMENKGRFPLSHGTAAAVSMNIRSCLKTEGFGHGFARIVGFENRQRPKRRNREVPSASSGQALHCVQVNDKNKATGKNIISVLPQEQARKGRRRCRTARPSGCCALPTMPGSSRQARCLPRGRGRCRLCLWW